METFARRFLAEKSAVGGRFGIERGESSREYEIVGVVRDSRTHYLWQDPPRLVYFPVAQTVNYLESLQVLSQGDLAAVIPQVRQVLSEVAPDLPLGSVRSLTEQIHRSLRQERLLSQLTAFFGLLALLLASIGLYGVLAFSVSQRTNEIGLRIALGAERAGLVRMVLGTAMRWVGIGVAIGLPTALAVGHLLSSQLFGLAPTDPATILLATGLLALVATLASYWPARRASRLDPIQALRNE